MLVSTFKTRILAGNKMLDKMNYMGCFSFSCFLSINHFTPLFIQQILTVLPAVGIR
jgi:hypothetical protein